MLAAGGAEEELMERLEALQTERTALGIELGLSLIHILYPTHEIGPISQYLNINRGNRFLTLSCTASKAVALNKIAGRSYGDGLQKFQLGDFITTVLKCANGETVVIRYDTSLPRPYSRSNAVHGTKGVWMELNRSIYIDGVSPAHKWEDVRPYIEKYEHPIWRRFLEAGVQGGHDGMDYLLMKAFAWSCLLYTSRCV